MTALANSFEGGSDGTGITAANSGGGSGNAFDVVSVGNGTLKYSKTHIHSGTLEAAVQSGSPASTDYFGWTTSLGTLSEIYLRFYLYATANPAAVRQLCRCTPGSGGAGMGLAASGGKFVTLDTSNLVVATSSNAIALNAWNRIEFHAKQSATLGVLEARLYLGADVDKTGTNYTELMSNSNQNTGSSAFTNYLFGLLTSVANFGPFWVADVAASTVGWIDREVYTFTISCAKTETPTKAITQQAQLKAIKTETATKALVQQAQKGPMLLVSTACGALAMQAQSKATKIDTPIKTLLLLVEPNVLLRSSTAAKVLLQQPQMTFNRASSSAKVLTQRAQMVLAHNSTASRSLGMNVSIILVKAETPVKKLVQRVQATLTRSETSAKALLQQARITLARSSSAVSNLKAQGQSVLFALSTAEEALAAVQIQVRQSFFKSSESVTGLLQQAQATLSQSSASIPSLAARMQATLAAAATVVKSLLVRLGSPIGRIVFPASGSRTQSASGTRSSTPNSDKRTDTPSAD